jgi:hypothetical protein
MVGVKLAEEIPPAMVTTKPDHQGEYEISRNTIACGNAGCPGATVVTTACAYYTLCTRLRVQRAPGIPRSLLRVAPRPCWAEGFPHNSGSSCRENADIYLDVIASQRVARMRARWLAMTIAKRFAPWLFENRIGKLALTTRALRVLTNRLQGKACRGVDPDGCRFA